MILRNLVIVVALTCAVSPVNAEEIKIEGGGAAVSSVFQPCRDAYEEETGVDLTIAISTPGRALIALEKGEVDVATGAVPLEYMLEQAASRGVKIDRRKLQTTSFAINKTLVFLNQDNPVKSLSKDQLKAIFTGKITNWRDVGGNDLSIEVVWGNKTPGQNALFRKLVLDGQRVAKKKTKVESYNNIRDHILKNPGAIGIDPEGFKTRGINVPQTPPIAHPVLAVTKGPPSPKVQRLFQYIQMIDTE